MFHEISPPHSKKKNELTIHSNFNTRQRFLKMWDQMKTTWLQQLRYPWAKPNRLQSRGITWTFFLSSPHLSSFVVKSRKVKKKSPWLRVRLRTPDLHFKAREIYLWRKVVCFVLLCFVMLRSPKPRHFMQDRLLVSSKCSWGLWVGVHWLGLRLFGSYNVEAIDYWIIFSIKN
jgi:hypothetical protein